MKVDENTQLFLVIVWTITVLALIASIWLFRDIRATAAIKKKEPYYPFLVRPDTAKPLANKLVPPPPPVIDNQLVYP